jgi:polyphosphate kinase 2
MTQCEKKNRLSGKRYEKELTRLQAELVKLQLWVTHTGARAIVVFEGRDAAGKGGVIKRITERVSPRVFRVVALPAPTDREKTQMYVQRYITHFPAGGEVVLFDRSWYNRAGVEKVMGFCTEKQYADFLENAPGFEGWIIRSGITLIKYWFDVGMEEQEKRFKNRVNDPRKVWKLSPMDLASYDRWYDYSRARDAMFEATDSDLSPWNIVRADDKKRARLNCITHLLGRFPYEDVPLKKVKFGKRKSRGAYHDEASIADRRFVPEVF